MPNGFPQLPTIASLVAPFTVQENALAGVLTQIGLPQLPPGPAGVLSTLPPLPGLPGQATGATRARGAQSPVLPGVQIVNF